MHMIRSVIFSDKIQEDCNSDTLEFAADKSKIEPKLPAEVPDMVAGGSFATPREPEPEGPSRDSPNESPMESPTESPTESPAESPRHAMADLEQQCVKSLVPRLNFSMVSPSDTVEEVSIFTPGKDVDVQHEWKRSKDSEAARHIQLSARRDDNSWIIRGEEDFRRALTARTHLDLPQKDMDEARELARKAKDETWAEVQEAQELARRAKEELYQYELESAEKDMQGRLEAAVKLNSNLEQKASILATKLGESEERWKSLHPEVHALRCENRQVKVEVRQHELEAFKSQRESDSLKDELQTLRREVAVATQQQQSEGDASKQALDAANAQVEKLALEMQKQQQINEEKIQQAIAQAEASEDKRKAMMAEVEASQHAIDAAEARAEKNAKEVKHLKKVQAKMEASHKEELLACEQKAAAQQAELEDRAIAYFGQAKKMIATAKDRGDKYKKYACWLVREVQALRREKVEDLEAGLPQEAESDEFFFLAFH